MRFGPGKAANFQRPALLIIVLVILLVGGGGWYGQGRWY